MTSSTPNSSKSSSLSSPSSQLPKQTKQPRLETWARVQQRFRRNCIIGPVAFCLLVIVGFPYIVDYDQQQRWMIEQRIPFVEAVPFFRRRSQAAIAFLERRRKRQQRKDIDLDDDDDDEFHAVPALPPVVISVSGGASASADTASGTRGAAAAVAEPEEVPIEKADDETEATVDDTSSSTTTISLQEIEYNFPLFTNAAEFEKDSSKAPVPFRFYEAHQRKDDTSRQAVLATLKWRKDMEIDTILSRPNPNYDITKRVLPHYFIGRSAVTNHVVFVQRPGVADVKLGKHNGVDFHDILNQYAYVFEYCWNILHTNTQETMDGDEDLMISIMDLQGLNLGLLRKADLINMAKEIVGMIDAHYPTRAYKTYMVNAPGWFSTLYKLISPIMRETTKEKIVLYSPGKDQDEALEAALGKEMADTVQKAIQLPDKKKDKKKDKNDLSLSSDILLETDMENEIREFVMQRLQEVGMEMKPIVPTQ